MLLPSQSDSKHNLYDFTCSSLVGASKQPCLHFVDHSRASKYPAMQTCFDNMLLCALIFPKRIQTIDYLSTLPYSVTLMCKCIRVCTVSFTVCVTRQFSTIHIMVFEKTSEPSAFIYLYKEPSSGDQQWWIGPELNGAHVFYCNSFVINRQVPCWGWEAFVVTPDETTGLTKTPSALKLVISDVNESRHNVNLYVCSIFVIHISISKQTKRFL